LCEIKRGREPEADAQAEPIKGHGGRRRQRDKKGRLRAREEKLSCRKATTTRDQKERAETRKKR
jgi:hypothetical protein